MALRRRLLASRPDPSEAFEQVASGLAPALVFLASIPIAYLVSPKAAQLTWIALLVINPTIGRIVRRRARRRAASRSPGEGEPS
jgi:TMEM175 potassium channel family protein